MESRGELTLWRKRMIERPQLALSMRQLDLGKEEEAEEKGGGAQGVEVFSQRGQHSSVLTGNAMLKVDYFPGCAQLSIHAEAESAINLRYIDAMGVAGAAIPTQAAMQEVVLLCARKWAQKRSSSSSAAAPIHWICLREEPVLYVNSEPVVLRELHQPYENLVFTGITSKRVEAMERTLCEDATAEFRKFEDKLLIHAESDTGNLMAEWEPVTPSHIMTCHAAYTAAFAAAHKLQESSSGDDALKFSAAYHRLPITDEQAPPPAIVDTFVALFARSPTDAIFVFNCQMGRGRTTTAMAICALWKRRCGLCELKAPPHQTAAAGDVEVRRLWTLCY